MNTPTADEIRSIYHGIEHRSGLRPDYEGWNSEGPIIGNLIPKMRPKVIFDVGVWNGRGTCHMARLARANGIDVLIYAVDVFFGLVPGAIGHLPESQLPVRWDNPTRYQQFLFNVKAAGFDDRIIPVCNFTRWGAKILANWGVKADIIYIDASHDEEFVYVDLCEYWPLLAPGGVMTGDDYSPTYPGVQRAIERFCKENGLAHEVVGGHWKLTPKREAVVIVHPPSEDRLMVSEIHDPKQFSVKRERGLSGIVPVRNNFHLDYLAVQAVESLLPVCDEVIVVDGQSDDGTREHFLKWAENNPKISVVEFPWSNPVKDTWLMVKWIAAARPHLRYDMQIQLDADEVLHPDAYPEIRRAVSERGSRWLRRVNFWRDAQHEIPDGIVIGRMVTRLGPSDMEMPSDNSEPRDFPMRKNALYHPKLLAMHYGFLREQEAFLRKSRVMQMAVLGDYDPKLAEAERTGQKWHELSNANIPLEPYTGNHPDIMHHWLTERGLNP